MNKIIADRMLVDDDDELHFRDADAQNKLKNLIVQGKGDSETAVMSQAAATVEFDKLSEDIDDLKEVDVFYKDIIKSSENLFDPDEPTNTYGVYVTSIGTWELNSNYITTDFIPVKAGDVLNFRSYIKDTMEEKPYDARIVFYDESKKFIGSPSGVINNCTVEVNGYVRLCDYYTIQYNRLVMFTKNTSIKGYEPKYTNVAVLKEEIEKGSRISKTVTNHAKGTTGDYPTSLRTGYIAYYEEYADTFGIVDIKRGENNGTNEIVRVGVTSLQYACAGVWAETVSHGLTWKDVRCVKIDSINLAQTKVTLITNGGMFEHTFDRPKGYGNNGVWTASAGTIVQQIAKPNDIWIIGDSYMSYDDSRIGGALYAMGVKSPTILSIPGATTTQMATELEKMLVCYGVSPRVVAVCTGMNDTIDTYTNGLASVLELSNQYGFEVVVTKLAVSPDRIENNTAVNAYVDSLGLDTIRFDHAVGANDSGAWLEGCLNADNVHPSKNGAMLMACEILAKVGYLENQ